MKLFGARSSATPPVAGFSVVDDRLTIQGDIETEGAVRVDGRVAGAVHRAGTLIVGIAGHIVGDVEAREVVVAGKIHGNVNARGRVEIDGTGSINGDVHAAVLSLREGGTIDGHVAIGLESQAAGPRRLELAQPAQAAPGRARG